MRRFTLLRCRRSIVSPVSLARVSPPPEFRSTGIGDISVLHLSMPRTLSNTDFAAKQNRRQIDLSRCRGYLTNPTASRLCDEFHRVRFTLRAYASFNTFGKHMKIAFTDVTSGKHRAEIDNEANK